ncbi:toxin-antitoxin system YwqK family antitoxin [Gilliamella sp. B2911]|uniref:toxin-antitoxin system YwqK family antitoxin n=1 Tax=Gilliamella sp. B2911 TaxID=2817980 RepID=UPI002269FB68|nr:hypothetical protein [Gilliamella sp. B2911]MCX8662041.1 hypothetical protein [Gilliamella sp. B2911]
MKKLLIVSIFFVGILACVQRIEEKKISEAPPSNSVRIKESNTPEGFLRYEYYINGNKAADYIKTYYAKGGQLESVYYMSSYKPDGISAQGFYPNGKLKFIRYVRDEVKKGDVLYVIYYPNGQINLIETIVTDSLELPKLTTIYFENGVKQYEGFMDMYNATTIPVGLWKTYDEKGDLIETTYYHPDELGKDYKIVTQYKNGKVVSKKIYNFDDLYETELKELFTIPNNTYSVNIYSELPYTNELSFGKEELISTHFPKKWTTQFWQEKVERNNSRIQRNYDSVIFYLSKYSNDYLYPELYLNPQLTILKDRFYESEMSNLYYDKLQHFFDKNIKKDNYLSPVSKININDKNLNLFLLTSSHTTLKDKPVYNSEYEPYNYSRMDLITTDSTNTIDKLNVYYSLSWVINGYRKLFFIDKNNIIHIKYFEEDEEDTHFIRYEKFQISPEGKFIRYYDQNGFFQNEEEQGLVENHTREGLWVEKKPNGYYTYLYTYLEANYQKGLPIGIWKFYKLDYQEMPEGSVELSSAKKGKLLYTETYKDGELIERKFVDNEIDEMK